MEICIFGLSELLNLTFSYFITLTVGKWVQQQQKEQKRRRRQRQEIRVKIVRI